MLINTSRTGAYVICTVIILFAMTASWNREIARFCEAVVILASLLCFKSLYSQDNNRSTLILLLTGCLLVAVMVYANYWAKITYPEDINHERFSRFYSKLLLFIPVGWWLSRLKNSGYLLIAGLIIGMTVTIIQALPELSNLTNLKSRSGLGFSNAQHGAMYGGSLLLMLLCCIPRALAITSSTYRMLALIGLFVLLMFSLWIVILTKSRGAWLGLAFTAPVILFLLLRGIRCFKSLHLWKTLLITALITAVLLGGLSQLSFVKDRLAAEPDTYKLILQGDFEKIPMSSIGIRLQQWSLALELIKDRPLLGYGGDTKVYLIAQSDMPDAAKENFGHFHNSYLELTVAYGPIALLLFVGIIFLLTYRSYQYLRRSSSHCPLVYLGLLWPIFFAIANIFESYVMYRTGYVLLAVVGGIIYGASYRNKNQSLT